MKKSIQLEKTEIIAAYKAMKLLENLYDIIPEGEMIVSPETGEVVCRDELGRAIGILHGLTYVHNWDVE